MMGKKVCRKFSLNYESEKMTCAHLRVEISTKHVLWPQVNSPMHGNQSVWGKLHEFVKLFGSIAA